MIIVKINKEIMVTVKVKFKKEITPCQLAFLRFCLRNNISPMLVIRLGQLYKVKFER